MARVNVYLPDDLAEAARVAELNVSALTQDALRRALAGNRVDLWLRRVSGMPAIEVGADALAHARSEAKAEFARAALE
jgi:post-segregation antitoxin (ccd killing protein)